MVTVTLSVNFLFILVAIARFTLPEALAIAAVATIVQCVWQAKKSAPVHSGCLQHQLDLPRRHCRRTRCSMESLLGILSKDNFLLLALTAAVYFIVNTVLVAGVVALTENKSIYRTWYSTFFWAMQYHLAAAIVAWQILILKT